MLITAEADDDKVGAAKAYESFTKVAIGSFQVGVHLSPTEKDELVAFLKQHIDVFSWDPYEAPGINSDFMCHQLNVNTET